MRRLYFRGGIAVVTLAVGVLSNFTFEVYKEINRSLNNSKAVINPDAGKPKTLKLTPVIDGEFMEVDIDENEPFTLLGHACGHGYIDGYVTSDGERLSAGLDVIEPTKFKEELSKFIALEKIMDFENDSDKKGTRFLLKGQNSKTLKNFFEIVWYNGKDEKRYITAPSVELASKFEEWDKVRK